jgi:hypothetical protein
VCLSLGCAALDGCGTICPAVTLVAPSAAGGKRPRPPQPTQDPGSCSGSRPASSATATAAAADGSGAGAASVRFGFHPEDLCRRVYTLGKLDVTCCEKLQLVDEETRGLGQVVWDAGLVLAAHLAES